MSYRGKSAYRSGRRGLQGEENGMIITLYYNVSSKCILFYSLNNTRVDLVKTAKLVLGCIHPRQKRPQSSIFEQKRTRDELSLVRRREQKKKNEVGLEFVELISGPKRGAPMYAAAEEGIVDERTRALVVGRWRIYEKKHGPI